MKPITSSHLLSIVSLGTARGLFVLFRLLFHGNPWNIEPCPLNYPLIGDTRSIVDEFSWEPVQCIPGKIERRNQWLFRSVLAGALLLIITLSAGISAGYAADPIPGEPTVIMKLSSTAFSHNGEIPKRYTCDDANLSPPPGWSDLSAGTQSLALIVDDPDAPDPAAPKMIWVH